MAVRWPVPACLWILLLHCGTVCAASSASASQALAPALDRRLSLAANRVVAASGAFGRLREALGREPRGVTESLQRGLAGPEEVALLTGRGEVSKGLAGRFETLQSRSRELLAGLAGDAEEKPAEEEAPALREQIRAAVAAEDFVRAGQLKRRLKALEAAPAEAEGPEAEGRPAEAVNSTEPSDEASDAEASGAETAPAGSATGDASGEAAASAELCNASSGAEGLAEELETLARDLESHFARVSLSALSRLPPDARRRLEASFLAAGAAPGGPPARAPGADAQGPISDAERDVSERIARLTDVARRLGDPAVVAKVRRLGARLARLGGKGSSADLDAISADSQEVLAQIERSIVGGAQSTPQPESGMAEDGGCTVAVVAEAAKRFDAVARAFQGKVLNAMLPPEVENLHRVVHSLEVLKNSLLSELKQGVRNDQECARYLSGVGQLEADLSHYKELTSPKRPPQESPGKGSSLPQPQQPPARLEPLVVDTGLAAGGAGGGAGGGRPALDVRSFR